MSRIWKSRTQDPERFAKDYYKIYEELFKFAKQSITQFKTNNHSSEPMSDHKQKTSCWARGRCQHGNVTPMLTRWEILCCSIPNGINTHVSYSSGSLHLKIRMKSELSQKREAVWGSSGRPAWESAVRLWASLSLNFLIFESRKNAYFKGCYIPSTTPDIANAWKCQQLLPLCCYN